MEQKERKKVNFWFFLRILVIIGWISLLLYSLSLVRYLGTEYQKDPSNFVFFEDEEDRESYRASMRYKPSVYGYGWINNTSLISECKPAIFINDFYMQRVDPFIWLAFGLVVLTIISKLTPAERQEIKERLSRTAERLDQEGENENKDRQ